MKTASWILKPLAVLIGSLFITSQAHAWFFDRFFYSPPKSETIAEVVAASGGEFDGNSTDYDALLTALKLAGLVGALDDSAGDFTVFAPNDAAFIRLAKDLGYEGHDEGEAFATIAGVLTELGGGDPIPLLTNILLYHVSPESKSLRKIYKTKEISTLLEGATIFANYRLLIDNDPEFKNPKILSWRKGVSADNGVIYPISRVLIPADLPAPGQDKLPTITGTVAASGGNFDHDGHDFDILLNAVLAAGLDGILADAEGTFTVFAPNDYAFVRLARDLGYQGWDEAGAFDTVVAGLTSLGGSELLPILTSVLLYHVSLETLTAKDVLLSDQIETALEGASFRPEGFRLQDNAPTLRDPRLVFSGLNLLTSNGRIHVINRVLIPLDISQ
jgi:serralysin